MRAGGAQARVLEEVWEDDKGESGERCGLKPQEFAGVGQGGRGDDFAAEKAGDFANAGFAV